MSYYEEDTPDVSENERERAHEEEIIGIPGQPDWPSGANYADNETLPEIKSAKDLFPKFPDELPPEFPTPTGFLRTPDAVRVDQEVLRLRQRVEELENPLIVMNSTIEQTDAGENHKELMEMLGAMFVQLSRIYDVLMMTLPEGKMRSIDEIHESGGLAASPPILREDAWDEDNSASKN